MPTLVKRKQIMLYINTATTGTNEEWKLYGKKSVTATYSYNPNSTSETYITDDNATVTLDSYNITIDGSMKCYYGDAVYDYINKLRYNLATGSDATTKVLLVDRYIPGDTDSSFQAQTFESTVSIEGYGGDGGVVPDITFTIGLNGDPTQGSVTFAGEVPTFTEKAG